MKDNVPLVSVLMPTFNSESTIKNTIESILAQSLQDFELIIIDDGSVDRTRNIIREINDSRVKYFFKKNGGISSALNLGLTKCNSDIVARIDSDDFALKDRLKTQYDFLKKNKQCVMVGTAVEYIDLHGNVIGRTFPIVFSSLAENIFRYKNIYAHPSVMFKKDAVLSVNGYSEELSGLFEDYYLWSRLRKIGQCKNMHYPLTQYRILEGQITDWEPNVRYYQLMKEIIASKYIDSEKVNEMRLIRERKRLKIKTLNFSRISLIKNNRLNRLNSFLIKLNVNKKLVSYTLTFSKNIVLYLNSLWRDFLYGFLRRGRD